MSTGTYNALIDVAGIRVGHHTAVGNGALTGTTVVLAPSGGMLTGVDVRGGGPGTRETDLLNPLAGMDRVDAVVLTGGSAYGLSAASGVADALGEQGVGYRVGPGPGEVVPIVPAAVIFDLGRGGDFAARPDSSFGRSALAAAQSGGSDEMASCGSYGAGVGALVGGLRGGVGTASAVLPDGSTVAALVVVNAAGSAVDPATGALWGAGLLQEPDGAVPAVTRTGRATLAEAAAAVARRAAAAAVGHTTLVVLATDATLTKAQCGKLAGMAHDGMARALNPVHTMVDGDVAFAASTAAGPAPDRVALHLLLTAGADVVTRAIVRAVLAVESVTPAGVTLPSYRDLLATGHPGPPDDGASRSSSTGGPDAPTELQE